MAVFKRHINIVRQHYGNELRKDMADKIAENNGFLPRPISYYDLDKSFYEFAKNELAINSNGEKIPVIKIIGLQKWAEFAETWGAQDETNKYRDIKLPFITVVRKLDPQPGTNQAALWNIPGQQLWTYHKVPTTQKGRVGMDLYKIPQPTAVDLSYEIRLFSDSILTLNDFNQLVNKVFRSRQFYIFPNQNPMPIVLEGNSDQSNIEDLQSRRYYTQLYEFKLLAYILDEKDFIVTPAIDRIKISAELMLAKCGVVLKSHPCEANSTIAMNIIIKPFGESTFTITSQYNMSIISVNFLENVSSVSMLVNGVAKTLPFSVNQNDTLTFSATKVNYLLSKFSVIGNLV